MGPIGPPEYSMSIILETIITGIGVNKATAIPPFIPQNKAAGIMKRKAKSLAIVPVSKHGIRSVLTGF